ncbi:MAG: SLC13 family permease [Pirellulaceae bacterium]|nr:SLC13 family permease [Pirellulaceae bacterium]MDP6722742.1 SLC13 family permease [Pirellulaceae bacterium]
MGLSLLATTEHQVAGGITALFAVLLAALILCLALEEKLHAKKSVIAGVFAIICLLLGAAYGVLPFDNVVVGSHAMTNVEQLEGDYILDVDNAHKPHHIDEDDAEMVHVGGHRLDMPVYIPGINWAVIAIILGSSLFVDVTSRSGLFTWLALKVTKLSRGDPIKLLYCYGITTVIFSAVLNNVTAMIIVGSLTAVSLEKLGRRKQLLAFLLIEGLLTNIGGLLTLISSVPNIIVGTTAGISFLSFFMKAAPFVVVATALTIWMGARLFGIKSLVTTDEREAAKELVSSFDENDGVESWGFFFFSTAMLILFIILIATASVLPANINHLGMGFIAMAFAGIMLVRYKHDVDTFYKSVDWDLLGFFMALFVVIYVMEHARVLATMGGILESVMIDITLESANWRDSVVLLWGSAACSSVTDNIPLAAMLSSILVELGAPTAFDGAESGLWWALVFGANLGGNLTPIGSASTLVAVTIMHKHELPLSFIAFVKAAVPYALVQLLLATVYVLVFLR